jgi:ribonuclease R
VGKKSKSKPDPYRKREAKKYAHPIASREFIIQTLEEIGHPVTLSQLQKQLDLFDEEQSIALNRRLRAMMRDGQLMSDRRGRYCLINKLDLLVGRVIGHPDGFGFVELEKGGDDLFLSANQMRRVFHGDKVLVRKQIVGRRNREEAIILEVIEANTQYVVGRYFEERGIAFVEPDNRRITQDVLIPAEFANDAKHEQMVVVDILEQPTARKQPIGQVREILGEHRSPGMEIDVAIHSHNLPNTWSEAVLEDVGVLPDEVTEDEKQGRKDLRDLNFVTIDGADAQDFDDAVYCQPNGRDGYRLFVAIADVSHYVEPGSPLDTAALERGNSVYFPGRVVPMLPEKLSNNLCSLRPKVDRLCMVCEMSISAKGRLSNYKFYQAVMHSKARLTYSEVAAMLVDDDQNLQSQYKDVFGDLQNLYALFQVLHASRVERGAIDFDLKETRIVFDENKKIKEIVPTIRNDAHRLIEECMLMANIAAARFIEKHKIPGLFRIHSEPPADKITGVRTFLAELGLELSGGKKPKPLDYTKLLQSITDRPDFLLIQKILLYSLSQAEYSPQNIGHFGLAFAAYAHFTSPIRRYPDLLVHRAIAHIINHEDVTDFQYSDEEMLSLGAHFSFTERRADDATRDVTAWLKCEFMLDKVGQQFEGTVSSVTNFGLFVELNDFYVEGLVHVTGLKNDYYHYDAVKHRLVGERTKTIYRLGDPIRVDIVRVDLDERKIYFELADAS